jgi:putative Holliday junction resolvase
VRRGTIVSSGVRIGVDIGSVRVGVAVSDPSGVLATPLVTLRRDAAGDSDITRLVELVAEHGAVEIVVGLPRSLSGREGPAAQTARRYAGTLADRAAPVPVQLVDERLTTVVASRTLTSQGVRGKRQRAVVDQAAAVLILQSWLDSRRSGTVRERDE